MSQTTTAPAPSLAQRVSDWAQPITAYLVLGSFAAALFLAYWFKDTDSMKSLVSAVQNFTALIVGFYFGSSRGSQKKDEVIGSIAQSAPTPPTPTTTGTTP